MSNDDNTFLNRWSRLKRRVSLERQATAKPPVAPQAAPTEALSRQDEPQAAPVSVSPEKPREDEGPVDVSKLPSIESLGPDSDYSMFMRKGVPEDLRMKALRRMWMTDPVLAGPEVLDMYAWDYTGVDGHKPLARPVIEAVAAAAKAAKDAITDTAKKTEPRDGETASSDAAAPQQDAVSENRSSESAPKPG